MENTSRLYDTLMTTMVKLVKWVDIRHSASDETSTSVFVHQADPQ
jgi:hypothetical protein